ncbi:MAG: PucR family transcriptional regulator [Thermoleophilaceae bacterium]
MREILRAARDRDADVVAWLEVIEQFDHAVAAGASVEELVRLAADMTGLAVGVRDKWNRVQVEVARGTLRTLDAGDADFVSIATEGRPRGRGALAVDTPRGPALSAPIVVGSGPAGFAWVLSPTGAAWKPGHHLVVERLAGAVAARLLEARRPRPDGFDPAAVERLLCVELGNDDLARASRQAKLSLSDRYVAIALAQVPVDSVPLETLAAIAQQAIAEREIAARGAVIGRHGAVVARAGSSLEAVLGDLAGGSDRLGFEIRIGVGDVHGLSGLPASWRHAEEALVLADLLAVGSDPAYFDRLGVLHLLAQIPAEHVLASEPFRRLTDSLQEHGSPSDVEVLEAYLEEGTLRRAGDRVLLHHTTVQHRLKSLAERLQVDLHDPATRFQVQLALKLLGISRAKAAAAGAARE